MPTPNEPIPPAIDWTPIQLSTESQFDLARQSVLLDETEDIETSRNLCKLLFKSWMAQKAATLWAMRQGGGLRK
jgi:hypothetical protein